jgi:hypothetical protein
LSSPTVELLTVPQPAEKSASSDRFEEGAIYTLALLQREGRLVDFLQEEIEEFEDAQIGAAVRQIHAQCRNVIAEHFSIRPVIENTEGSPCEVPADFDPSEIRLTGNVPTQPPYRGTLLHKGWNVAKVNLPMRSGAIKASIVQAAEVNF